jgi:O-Antigen ligase
VSTPSYDVPAVAPVKARRASTATTRTKAGWRSALARLGPLALPFAIALAVFLLALQSGGYGLEIRGGVAIGIWWAIALGVGILVWPAERVPRTAVLTGASLAPFGLAAGLSSLWADSAELAFGEFNRVMLYLGVFVLVVVSARRATAARWADGLGFGIAAVGILALVSRLFPRLIEDDGAGRLLPVGQTYLNYPIDYWNGLGILLGLSFPLLLRTGVTAPNRLVRGLAVGLLPAVATALYLTSSRGGAATAIVSTVALIALAHRRYAVLGAVAAATAGAVAAIAFVSARPVLVDGPVDGAAAVTQGRTAAIVIGLICLAVGIGYAVASRVAWSPPRIGRRLAIGLAVLAAVVVAGGVAAAHPAQRWDDFTAPPVSPLEQAAPGTGTGGTDEAPSSGEHLASTSGNGRWQFWGAAVDEFESRPLAGHGAGSYAAWWAEHAPVSYFTRRAHSLYLQTLGELGLLGGLLLLALIGCATAAIAQAVRRSRGDDRITVAALAAVCAGFAFAVAIDWMWELTVVSVLAAAALALVAGPAAHGSGEPAAPASSPRRRARWALRAPVVVVALGLVIAQAIPFAANAKIDESRKQAGRGDLSQALADAQDARDIQPWAASPSLQLALVHQERGESDEALSAIHEAIANDPSDWRLWLVSSNLELEAGNAVESRRDLARAASLNPRSPLFAKRARGEGTSP